jgi:acetyl-CoA carboxylase biotin carboxylase subunit
MDAIASTNCDAVHPGYGFLSERAFFAEACEKAGITFIGPSSRIIDLMGDKTRARQAVRPSGMPLVPGTLEPILDDAEALRQARDFGFPVMIKASAGGGGKGMRIVQDEAEMEAALRLARSEAQAAFGDSSVYLEKAIVGPHHVEVQVLADHHGNVVHLGERECSIQRRHQKVIEESPSPFISGETRHRMWESAVRAAREIGYTNAGTMEFLVDADQNFYFLEMNTRLQVEHPVTEMVSGIDLVQQQIRIASGEPLPFRQEDIRFRGAAIECRVYAEDPAQNFMPSPGRITGLRLPGGPGIRDDSGIYEGFEVPIYYDPLLSKLVAWAPTRAGAVQRIARALEEYQVRGIKTTIPFYQRMIHHPAFVRGHYTTAFIPEFFASEAGRDPDGRAEDIALIAAAIHEFEHAHTAAPAQARTKAGAGGAWKSRGWREAGR